MDCKLLFQGMENGYQAWSTGLLARCTVLRAKGLYDLGKPIGTCADLLHQRSQYAADVCVGSVTEVDVVIGYYTGFVEPAVIPQILDNGSAKNAINQACTANRMWISLPQNGFPASGWTYR